MVSINNIVRILKSENEEVSDRGIVCVREDKVVRRVVRCVRSMSEVGVEIKEYE